jgi:hypothetical protein
MKKDIEELKVEDIAIAIVPRDDQNDEDEEDLWDTYLINLKEEAIQSVLINSKGYGEINGEEVKTTVLRHFFELIEPLQVVKIEPIMTKVFSLSNEYWISFSLNNYLYDKQYVFVQGSINKENFTMIPFLNKKGVMIQ